MKKIYARIIGGILLGLGIVMLIVSIILFVNPSESALSGLLLMSGGLFDTPALLRMAAVLLCSCAGGVLGRALGEKKRRI